MALDVYTDERWDIGGGDTHSPGMKIKTRYYDLPEGFEPDDSDIARGKFLPTDSDYLITAVTSQLDKRGGGNVVKVVAVKPETFSGANPFGGGLVELSRSRGVTKEGDEKWTAQQIYISPNASAVGHENALWDQRYPSIGGAFSPRVRKVSSERDWLPGYSRIVALFKTIRSVGKAVLITKIHERKLGKLRKVTDKDGKVQVISGPSDGGKTYFKVIEGDDSLVDPFHEIIFQTAYKMPGFKLDTFNALHRHVNKSRLRNFGNAAPGTLWFRGVSNPGYEWGDDIINADLSFWWSGNDITWNQMLKTQEGIWAVMKMEKYARNATTGKPEVVANEFRESLQFIPGQYVTADKETTFKDSSPITIARFKLADFSVFDKFIVL